MPRGRSDRNEQLRHQRLTGAGTFYGNSTIVARACDRFFQARGIGIDGFRGLISREIAAISRKPLGSRIREDKADLAAAEIESSWDL